MNLKNKKFIFIVNPKSGKLSKEKKIKLISDCFPSNPDIVFAKDSQETSVLSAEAFKNKIIVIACGGDGTANLVANQAIIHNGIMSIFPFGRGNDFAKFIGINNEREFKKIFIKPKVFNSEYLDLFFKDTHKICLTSVGVGLLSEAAFRASKIPLLQGSLLYTIAALSCFINLKSHSYLVHLNKKENLSDKMTILVAASTPYAGGGMHIAPDAQKKRNKINLLYAKKVSRIEAIGLLGKVISGNHLGHQKVNNSHIKSCKIDTNENNFWAPLVYGDGEYLGDLPVDIQKGTKRLKLLIPNNETID